MKQSGIRESHRWKAPGLRYAASGLRLLKHQNTGLGRLLLANAISRVVRLQNEVGGVGVIVDAKPEAVGFYQGYGFEQLADHPGVLFLALPR